MFFIGFKYFKFAVQDGCCLAGNDDMSRKRRRLYAKIPEQERYRDDVQGPETRHRLEAGQMHVRGCRPRTYHDCFPSIVLYVDDTFSLSRIQVKNGRIHCLGTIVVLTYDLSENNGQKRHVFSNFGRIIRRLWYGKVSVPAPKAPGQTVLDGF